MTTDQIIYSAMDIARLLVRNPEEFTRFATHERLSQKFCKNRPIDELSREEKDQIFSREMAIEDLEYLGFSPEQIHTFKRTYETEYKRLDIDNLPADIPELYSTEHMMNNAYALATTFSYGPPIVLTAPYNVLARPNLSISKTRQALGKLQTAIADALMEIRFNENPRLFVATPQDISPIPSIEQTNTIESP